jgi:hypothetical protein
MMLIDKKLLIFGASSVFVAASTFWFNYSLLNNISKSDYASWSLQVGFTLIFFSFSFEWIRVGSIRLGVQNKNWLYYFKSISIYIYSSVVCFFILCSIFFEMNFNLILVISYFTLYVFHEYNLAKMRILLKKNTYMILQCVKGIAFFITSIFISNVNLYTVGSAYVNVPGGVAAFLLMIYLLILMVVYRVGDFSYSKPPKNKFNLLSINNVALVKFSSIFIFTSLISFSIFYVDRLLLKHVNHINMLAENSAVTEFLKQIIIFPINIVSIYYYDREIKLLGDGKSYKSLLYKKLYLFLFILFSCCVSIYMFNIFFAKFYFPSSYLNYWNENWFLGFMCFSLYSIKVYFFDQYFVSVKRLKMVLIGSFIMFITYIIVFFFAFYIFDIVNVLFSLFVAVVVANVFSLACTYKLWTEKRF